MPDDIRVIPFSKLRINDRYHMPVNQRFLAELTEPDPETGEVAFKPALSMPLVVADNGDDTFTVLDGHLRWRAAERVGLTKALCDVRHLDTDEDEARAFVEQNGPRRRGVTLFERMCAEVLAGDLNVEDAIAQTKARVVRRRGISMEEYERRVAILLRLDAERDS